VPDGLAMESAKKKELVAFEQRSSLFLVVLFRFLIKISQKAG